MGRNDSPMKSKGGGIKGKSANSRSGDRTKPNGALTPIVLKKSIFRADHNCRGRGRPPRTQCCRFCIEAASLTCGTPSQLAIGMISAR